MEDLDLGRIKRDLLALASGSSMSGVFDDLVTFIVMEKRRSFSFGYDKAFELDARQKNRERRISQAFDFDSDKPWPAEQPEFVKVGDAVYEYMEFAEWLTNSQKPKRKAYFYINAGVVCGVCSFHMNGDDEFNLEQIRKPGPWNQQFRCPNKDCEQFGVPLIISPWEVEVAQK